MMLKTLRLLRESKIIESYLIIDCGLSPQKIEGFALFEINDGSKLFIREYVSENEYIYS